MNNLCSKDLNEHRGESLNLNCVGLKAKEVLRKITLKLSYLKKLSLLLVRIWKHFYKFCHQ